MDNSFVDLSSNELEDINGGVGKFIADYALGKDIDFVIEHGSEIWDNFKKGPSKDDPMFSTPYVKIFG